MSDKMFCYICEKETKYSKKNNRNFVLNHLRRYHEITPQKYYDLYLKKENEGYCKICKSETKFLRLSLGYNSYCCNSCKNKHMDYSKTKNTWSKKGKKVLEELHKKRCKTKLKRYNNKNYNNPVKNKETNLKRHGDENYINFSKIKKTKLERYGDEFFRNHPKIKETKLKRYGDENYTNREKAKQTCLENKIYRSEEEKTKYEQYCVNVDKETKKWRKQLFEKWNGRCYWYGFICDSRVPVTKYSPIIEHKISKFYGFKNNINPKIIGFISNLGISSKKFNNEKGFKTIQQFIIYRANKILGGICE